jgi:hypothetical protein
MPADLGCASRFWQWSISQRALDCIARTHTTPGASSRAPTRHEREACHGLAARGTRGRPRQNRRTRTPAHLGSLRLEVQARAG